MKRASASEQVVAELVVAYLEQLGADVYQEVSVSGGVADIVAKVRAEIWIVEVKTSLSLALIAQAMERRRLAHRVFIAAPSTRNMRDVAPMCEELGIGLLEVWGGGFDYSHPRVRIKAEARRWNRKPVALAAGLKPEHKTHAKAGAVGAGGRWTPFRDTCEQLARVVREQPGLTVKQAVDQIKHHYSTPSTARSSLTAWIQSGKVPGVEIRRTHDNHGPITLYPTGEAA